MHRWFFFVGFVSKSFSLSSIKGQTTGAFQYVCAQRELQHRDSLIIVAAALFDVFNDAINKSTAITVID